MNYGPLRRITVSARARQRRTEDGGATFTAENTAVPARYEERMIIATQHPARDPQGWRYGAEAVASPPVGSLIKKRRKRMRKKKHKKMLRRTRHQRK